MTLVNIKGSSIIAEQLFAKGTLRLLLLPTFFREKRNQKNFETFLRFYLEIKFIVCTFAIQKSNNKNIMNTEEVKRRIESALDAAEEMGCITKNSSLEELMENYYEILEYKFSYEEMLILSNAVIEKVFADWRN